MNNDSSALGMLAFWLLLAPIFFIFLIAGYVIGSWFLMRIFDKAGVQGRWRAWVPVYNTLIFVKLGDLNPWWLLILWGCAAFLSWIPVIGQLFGVAAFVYTLLAAWRVGLKLQKEVVWLILYFFLAIVWLGVNAFDKSRWNTAINPAPWAGNFLADKTAWAGIPSQAAVGYGPGPVAGAGYAPPAGYQPPPPAGYGAPPAAGYAPPPPAGYEPPPAAPTGYEPPPAATPPAAAPPAAAPTPPVTPEPPAAPPAAPEPPAAEPPAEPEAPKP